MKRAIRRRLVTGLSALALFAFAAWFLWPQPVPVDFGQVVVISHIAESVESGSQSAAVLVGEATVQAVALKLELFVGSSLDDIAYSGHSCVEGSRGESRTPHSNLVQDLNAEARHVLSETHGSGRRCCGDRSDAVERDVSSSVGAG